MKKRISLTFILLVILLTLLINACSAGNTATTASGKTSGTTMRKGID